MEETSFKSEDCVLLHLPPPLWSSRSGWLGASPPEAFDLNSWFLGVCGSCLGAAEAAPGALMREQRESRIRRPIYLLRPTPAMFAVSKVDQRKSD